MDSMLELLSWRHLVGAGIVYAIGLVFYRFFLHPLARFPGPKLAAITFMYEGYYDVIQYGQYTFKIAELHKKYGPIIRINPNELHVIDPSFYKTIYRHDGLWDKGSFSQNAQPPHRATIATIDHHHHKARRQPMNGYFSKARVAAQQDMIRRHLTKLCDRITEVADTKKTFDLGITASAFTRDNADEYILGQAYNNLDQEDFNVAMTNMIQDVGYLWRVNKHLPLVNLSTIMMMIPHPLLKRMVDEGTWSFIGYLTQTQNDSKRLMRQWKEGTEKEKDGTKSEEEKRTIIHEILSSNLLPSEKTFKRIWDEVTTVTGAGFETSASALRLIYFHVWSNPTTILRRLREELRENNIPQDISSLDVKSLEKLPYLTAVITEGLRLSPAIATRMGRVAPDRDLVFVDSGRRKNGGTKGKEWVIPAGTTVGMTTLLMHLDEELYPNPREFNPERWMVPADARRVAEGNGTFAPFSRGTRICLGMYLAWAEMYMVLAALVQRFDFQFEGAKAEDFECSSDQFIIGTSGKGVIKAIATIIRSE